MTWIPGVPIDDGATVHGYRASRPMVTCHRTYGFWAGDYSVIKSGGLAHLLIGPDEGQWVQFAPTEGLMYHCNGSNDGYGVEVGGTNGDPMTDWQLRCLRYVVPQLQALIGVPLVYSDGADGWVSGHSYVGFHAHNGILTDDGSSQHTNFWTVDDWNLIVGPTALEIGDDMTPEEHDLLDNANNKVNDLVINVLPHVISLVDNANNKANELYLNSVPALEAKVDALAGKVSGTSAAGATQIDYDLLAKKVADLLAARLAN